MELVDVEFGGGGGRQILRLFIDKPGGVSLDDCSSVSRAVSAALDVEDPLDGSYDLEVSSPGLDRPLRTPEHFAKYAGSQVRVKTYGPLAEGDNRKTFIGRLVGYEDGKVVIDVDGTTFKVPHALVSKANVEPQFDN
jgi:ribosome maturation factor RimP